MFRPTISSCALVPMSEHWCNTHAVAENSFVIGRRSRIPRRFSLVRQPDGLALSAGRWDDVWSACPEFNVPWRNISFEDDDVRREVLKAWGDPPDMPA